MIHELKILPCYFTAVERGEKRFEIRDNSDRGFQKGDTVVLKEFEKGDFTGREVICEITYVTNFAQKENYVVFGFSVMPD